MKKTYWKHPIFGLNIAFLIAVFLLIMTSIYLVFFTEKNEATRSSKGENNTVFASAIIDPTQSNYTDIQKTTETLNRYNALAIHYPQSLHRPFNKDIFTYIEKAKKNPESPNQVAEEETEEEQTVDTLPAKRVALTFDDGPDPKATTQILEILKKHDAKATFFMLGSQVERYPEVAKSVKNAGHELGNHTWSHRDLTKAGAKTIREEINRTSSIIESVTGQKVTGFRPPYGAINEAVHVQTKLPVILWDVDTLDWKHRDPAKLLNEVKKATKDGSIILMHDVHQSTADGLDAVLTHLKSEGFTFSTVSELH